MPTNREDVMYQQGLEAIQRGARQDEAEASWNYYSRFGGTGMETPGLRNALYSIGRRKRRAEENLGAWYTVQRAERIQQEKWEKIWENINRMEVENP